MHLSFVSAVLAVSGAASAATIQQRAAPALPVSAFNTTKFHGITLDEALSGAKDTTNSNSRPSMSLMAATAATCSNPRIRTEWDNYSTSDRQAFVNAIKCLMNSPARTGGAAQNRYEDLVKLHQQVTPNVHSNAKFLIWHRYYLWVFEDMLRTECGFDRNLPWFDERKYSGKFSTSSIFSSQWFGSIGIGGRCVTNGQFANTNLHIGPGSGNTAHCLARNGDASQTINTNSAMVNACNSRSPYSNMAACAEGGAHAWGHNGIGAVMQDVYASPGDPVFFLHHAFIDRNFRVWQNADSSRINTIDGTDVNGNALTFNTRLYSNGLRPDFPISDFINTLGEKTCYRYDY